MILSKTLLFLLLFLFFREKKIRGVTDIDAWTQARSEYLLYDCMVVCCMAFCNITQQC